MINRFALFTAIIMISSLFGAFMVGGGLLYWDIINKNVDPYPLPYAFQWMCGAVQNCQFTNSVVLVPKFTASDLAFSLILLGAMMEASLVPLGIMFLRVRR